MYLDFDRIMATRTIQLDRYTAGEYCVSLQMVVKPGSAIKYKVVHDITGLVGIRINTLDIYAAVEVYGDCAGVVEGLEADARRLQSAAMSGDVR